VTAAFDHRDAGTPEPAWRSLVAALADADVPGRGEHLVVVAAHPDDETLGAGGLIASASTSGARVTVIIASDGEASHPESRTHTPGDLADRRRREVYAALAELAPDAEVVLLGLPDGRLPEHRAEIATAIKHAGGTHVVTPWRGDHHPDHEACAQAVDDLHAGVRHWEYPIWAWHWADPESADLPSSRLRRIGLDAATRAAKSRAIECHASQHRPLSDAPGDEALLGSHVLEHFRRDVEVFVVDEPPRLLSAAYFEDLYEQSPDPWGFDERFYERRKRAALLAALTRPRFRRAFEPGCATGLLTGELARRCDEVVAWDLATVAVEQAALRLAGTEHVTLRVAAIPDDWPEGRFDLIVLSEVGYYCADLDALAMRIEDSLDDDGVLVACHWRHPAPMHPHVAGTVHAAVGADRHLVVSHVEDDFLLQVWTRRGESVAAAEGIVR
jgi:LmbE family N-acetylglucosaminyl deacetylase/SAM-dependent methyltransferase